MSSSPCSVEALLPYPPLFGAEFLSMSASLVLNYTHYVYEGYFPNHGSVNCTDVTFCNVTTTHTHPGTNDTVTTQVWLPQEWNSRLEAMGGGGMVAGNFECTFIGMAGAIAEGYATVTTDGGLPSQLASDWALLSPGNLNLYDLQDFASVSLNDAAVIAKQLCNAFYGREPRYSYWNGCSQGGRQGYMLAQRYPNAFDGIAASAPAINFNEFIVGDFFPQQVMNELEDWPHPCEFDALTKATVDACDSLDGVVDGIIADLDSCRFDPFSMVGQAIECSDGNGKNRSISRTAATAAHAAWTGARDADGEFLWYGVGYGANLTGATSTVTTSCNASGECIGTPLYLSTDWMQLFILKDPDTNVLNLTRREYQDVFQSGVREFTSIIDTNFADLSDFRDAGGKLLGFHGTADEIIPYRGTEEYYSRVAAKDPSVHDYYRVFESPGLGHCYGGKGAYPTGLFDALVEWVEQNESPDRLKAQSLLDESGQRIHRILCPWPQKAHFIGKHGEEDEYEKWECTT